MLRVGDMRSGAGRGLFRRRGVQGKSLSVSDHGRGLGNGSGPVRNDLLGRSLIRGNPLGRGLLTFRLLGRQPGCHGSFPFRINGANVALPAGSILPVSSAFSTKGRRFSALARERLPRHNFIIGRRPPVGRAGGARPGGATGFVIRIRAEPPRTDSQASGAVIRWTEYDLSRSKAMQANLATSKKTGATVLSRALEMKGGVYRPRGRGSSSAWASGRRTRSGCSSSSRNNKRGGSPPRRAGRARIVRPGG